MAFRVAGIALLALLAVPALADPPEALLQHEGRLLGADNAPVTGARSLTFSLFHDPSGGDAAWTETRDVEFDAGGDYAVTFGDSTDGTHPVLPWSLFDGTPLYLAVTIDSVELSPRLPIVDVPTAHLARHALTADNVDCEGCIEPTALAGGITPDQLEPIPLAQTTGQLSTDQLADESVTAAKLAPSGCADGELLKWNDAARAWSCAADLDSVVTAGAGLAATGGTLAIAEGGVTASMLAQGGCADGQLLKWNDGAKAWSCSADLGTLVTAGPGLSFDGTALGVGAGALTGAMLAPGSVTADRLAQSTCADGELLEWSDAAKSWRCATDQGRDYVAGTGLDLSGSTFSIPAGGVAGSMLAPAAVTLDKLGGGCSSGQILKMTATGWACGTDDIGTTGTGGLAQVAVTSPLAGDGTSAGPLGIADGGIATAKLANGAVTADKLDGAMRTVHVVASIDPNFIGSVGVEVDGTALTVPADPHGIGEVVLVIFDASGAPTVEPYFSTSPGWATSVENRLDGLARGTSVLVAAVPLLTQPDGVWTQQLGALGFAEATRLAAEFPLGGSIRAWIGSLVTGTSRESFERIGPSGFGTSVDLSGWVVGGRFVAAPDRPASLSDADGNTVISVSSDDLELAGHGTLQFGDGLAGHQPDAGKIGYESFSPDALDIVGAGTTGSNRKIELWAEGGVTSTGNVTTSGTSTTETTADHSATLSGGDVNGHARLALRGGDPLVDLAAGGSLNPWDVRLQDAPGTLFGGANRPIAVLHVRSATTAGAVANPIVFSSDYASTTEHETGVAEISNDTGTYKSLMLVGNNSAGDGRRHVRVYDDLHVAGVTHVGLYQKSCPMDASAAYDDCACDDPAHEAVVNGGGVAGATNLVIRESRPLSASSWRLGCALLPTGVSLSCGRGDAGEFTITCARLGN